EDREQGFVAQVKSTGELKVAANITNTSVPVTGTVTVSSGSVSVSGTVGVSGTVDVSGTVTTKVIQSTTVNHNQVSVTNGTGGDQIIAAQSREAYTIKNLDATKTVYLGFGTGADASSG